MEYTDVIKDFAERTQKNLELIEKHAYESPNEAYEITQLINSMLGLLVFPKEEYFKKIPLIPLESLAERGWPVPECSGNLPQAKTLKDLIRYLRNAIAHFNIEFISGPDKQIKGLKLWNIDHHRNKNWEVKMTITDMRELTNRFLELILKQ